MGEGKDASVETIRGLAIVLVVLGHVLGSDAGSGLHVDPDSAWRWFYFSLKYVRMPLFTVISGYVYALRPVARGAEASFVGGKARRILVPMACVGTIFYLVQWAVPGVSPAMEPGRMWRIYLYSYEHFWFLQAVFLCFLSVCLLEAAGALDTQAGWAFCFAAAGGLFVVSPVATTFFSANNLQFLLPFFLLGVGIRRFGDTLGGAIRPAAAGPLLAAGLALQQMVWFGMIAPDVHLTRLLMFLVGGLGPLLLFQVRRPWPPLARLGAYAFGIYLFHVFFTAGTRIALGRLGVDVLPVQVAAGTVAGLSGPVVVELALRPLAIPRRLLLGLR